MGINKTYFALNEVPERFGYSERDVIHLSAKGQLSICLLAKGWLVDLYYRAEAEDEWKLLSQHGKVLGPVRLLPEDARLFEADRNLAIRRFGALLDGPTLEGFHEFQLSSDEQPDIRIADCELVVLALELKALNVVSDEDRDDSTEETSTLTEDLGTTNSAYVPPKRKAPDAFVAALIRLLTQIALRAGEKGLKFDVSQMPGQKADLLKVAEKFDRKVFIKSRSTFDTYISGLCQFGKGAKPSKFYEELFEENVTPHQK